MSEPCKSVKLFRFRIGKKKKKFVFSVSQRLFWKVGKMYTGSDPTFYFWRAHLGPLNFYMLEA